MVAAETERLDNRMELFQQKLKSLTKQAACGRSFVFVEELKKWLLDLDYNRVGDLLNEAYAGHALLPAPNISEHISIGSDCSLLVFSILLSIRQGHLIHIFIRKDIVDRNLRTEQAAEAHIRKFLEREHIQDAAEVARKFAQTKWSFCAPVFDLRMGHDYGTEVVLPIHKMRSMSDKGGTANLWEISVPEEFISEKLRKAVADSRYWDKKLGTSVCNSRTYLRVTSRVR
jgi:hypothetical protein